MSLPVRFSQRVAFAGSSPISHLMATALANPGLISLAAGFVDQDSLPVEAVRGEIASILSDPALGRQALQYGITPGDAVLRAELCSYLAALDGIPLAESTLTPDRIVLGTGSQQLLYLVAETLLDPGDIVLAGVPSYFVYVEALESFGARVVGVPTDDDGVRLDGLETALTTLEKEGVLDRVKFIYDVTSFSNPTGVSLSAERRPRLVDLARRWSRTNRILILDDAAYRELDYSGAPLPSLLKFDPDGDTVLYAGSFSKSFSPGLRAGYLVGPPDVLRPLLGLKSGHDFGSPNFALRTLARLLARGDYQRQVARLCDLYRAKAAAVLGTLDEELGRLRPRVRWTTPGGGMHLWMTLPDTIPTSGDGEFFTRCVDAGVLYVPGEHCYPRTYQPLPQSGLRMTFGKLEVPLLIEGVRRFCGVLRGMMGTAGS